MLSKRCRRCGGAAVDERRRVLQERILLTEAFGRLVDLAAQNKEEEEDEKDKYELFFAQADRFARAYEAIPAAQRTEVDDIRYRWVQEESHRLLTPAPPRTLTESQRTAQYVMDHPLPVKTREVPLPPLRRETEDAKEANMCKTIDMVARETCALKQLFEQHPALYQDAYRRIERLSALVFYDLVREATGGCIRGSLEIYVDGYPATMATVAQYPESARFDHKVLPSACSGAWYQVVPLNLLVVRSLSSAKTEPTAAQEEQWQRTADSTGHSMVMFVDTAHQVIEVFDSNGNVLRTLVTEALRRYFGEAYKDYKWVTPSDVCVRGPQSVEGHATCTHWALLYAFLRLRCPYVSGESLQRYLLARFPTRDQLRSFMIRWMCYLYRYILLRRIDTRLSLATELASLALRDDDPIKTWDSHALVSYVLPCLNLQSTTEHLRDLTAHEALELEDLIALLIHSMRYARHPSQLEAYDRIKSRVQQMLGSSVVPIEDKSHVFQVYEGQTPMKYRNFFEYVQLLKQDLDRASSPKDRSILLMTYAKEVGCKQSDAARRSQAAMMTWTEFWNRVRQQALVTDGSVTEGTLWQTLCVYLTRS